MRIRVRCHLKIDSKLVYRTTNARRAAVEDMNIPLRCPDVTVEPGRPSPMSLFRGTAEATLYCAHRTAVIHSIDSSKLAYLLFTGGWPVWPPTARVQRAPSKRARCASTGGQQATHSILLIFPHFALKGSRQTVLHCAHRTSTASTMLLPHSHLLSQEGGLFGLPLRASNEGLLRPRVARAKEANRLPSHSSLDRGTPLLTMIHATGFDLDVENVFSPATIIHKE
jgi:hypothetical protein